jgi:cytoskeletal protein CcmA (bactofilin family)
MGQSAAAPRPAARPPASALGAGLVFEGTISGDADLAIEGTVKGDVHVSRLIVGENAVVEGAIRAGQVEVRGRVVGDIEAQAVKLAESAHVEGDITHGQLSIDVGAYFSGRCQQFRRPDPAPVAASAPVFAAPEPQAAPAVTGQVVDFDAARA